MKYPLLFLFNFLVFTCFAQNFPSILYISDKAAIRNEAIPVLKDIVEQMRKDTTIKILIIGYTDNIGSEEFNKDLSERRAKSVASYIISKGIKAKRVEWKAEGSKNPVTSNATEEGREKNRRVEFQLIKRNDLSETPKVDAPVKTQQIVSEKKSGKPYVIEGAIIDEESKMPLEAEITIEEKETGKLIGKITTNKATGEYKLPVKLHDSLLYDLSVSAPKYFFDIQTIAPQQLKQEKKFSFNISQLVEGKSYKFKNINFVGNEATVLTSSIPSLNGLYRTLEKNPEVKIQIEGHTNGVGSVTTPETHKQLSEARAKSVKEFLVKKGIDEERIKTKGFGASKMLFPNAKNTQELEMNRRVEIKVTEIK